MNKDLLEKSQKEYLRQLNEYLCKKRKEGRAEFNFPVLLPSGNVTNASEIAQIQIPQNKKSWLFIAPTVEKEAKETLERILDVP